MSRQVQGLEWAKWAAAPAFARGRRRLSAPQRAGLAFQRKTEKALVHFGQNCKAGPWISYRDRVGPGLAQPDIVLVLPEGVLVLEIKLKFTLRAIPQLDALYVPLLQHLFPSSPIWRAVLCKHAAPEISEFHAFPAVDASLSDLCPHEAQRTKCNAQRAMPVLLWPKITPTLFPNS